MEILLEKEKPKQKLPWEGKYFSFDCPQCKGNCYVSEPMKRSILTCSFCGKQITEFKLKAAAEKEAKIKKIISEMINLKLLSSVKDMLKSDKFEVQPPSSSFGYQGKWDTKYGLLLLEESEKKVDGSYSLNGGRIRGTIRGNNLIGKWSQKPSYSEPNDAGDVEFRLSDDGKSFKGRWKFGSTGDWNFDWKGKLIVR
jgi:hypothetical protein